MDNLSKKKTKIGMKTNLNNSTERSALFPEVLQLPVVGNTNNTKESFVPENNS